MTHSTECPCGRPRAGCEYHDPVLQGAESAKTYRLPCGCTSAREHAQGFCATAKGLARAAPAELAKPKLSFAELDYTRRLREAYDRCHLEHASGATLNVLARLYDIDREESRLRLLGPDAPEVSSDLIYLDESTGGVVAVPR